MSAATNAQLAALKWLKNRNGDGMFERNNSVVLAGGERAPVMRRTWNKLRDLGLVEVYANGKRVRVTDAGKAVNLSMVDESRGDE